MDGKTRRDRIIKLLKKSESPISGSALAREMQVSRQVIVQDIALLRTEYPILAAARGYILDTEKKERPHRIFLVKHTEEQIADELYTIVDAGGRVLNVLVEHDIYGQIAADLVLTNRREIDSFCEQLRNSSSGPLSMLSGGVHMHTVDAPQEEILDYIEEQLKQKGYLLTDSAAVSCHE